MTTFYPNYDVKGQPLNPGDIVVYPTQDKNGIPSVGMGIVKSFANTWMNIDVAWNASDVRVEGIGREKKTDHGTPAFDYEHLIFNVLRIDDNYAYLASSANPFEPTPGPTTT